MELIPLYFLIINAAGFSLMLLDKWKAQKNLWRISERTLFAAALLGGSLGCFTGMYLARHKTQHCKFTVGIPMILCIQVGLAVWLLTK